MVKFFPIQHQDSTCYTFAIVNSKTRKQQYIYQQVCRTKAEAHLKAYFFCLRASLDQKPYPALIIDLESERILSMNLAGFELFAIHAIGFKISDFIVSLENYQKLRDTLNQPSPSPSPSILVQNADGNSRECQGRLQLDSHYPQWGICYLIPNQFPPDVLRRVNH